MSAKVIDVIGYTMMTCALLFVTSCTASYIAENIAQISRSWHMQDCVSRNPAAPEPRPPAKPTPPA